MFLLDVCPTIFPKAFAVLLIAKKLPAAVAVVIVELVDAPV